MTLKTNLAPIGAKLKTFMRVDLGLVIASIIIFLLFPNLDLSVAANYYHDGNFTYANNGFVRFIYLVFAKIHIVYLLLLFAAIAFFSKKSMLNARKKAIFLTLSLILGPGILVNLVFKDNTLGRPRPQHIEEFGGKMTFTPVFFYSGECAKNCSFVSGHAAIGFYLMAVAWVRQRRIWLMYGIVLGATVGFVRIIQGGHFLSDVIFAGWVTYFCCVALAWKMKIPFPAK